MLEHERSLAKAGYIWIIGVDEAGRGPLAGPVVAAAVALTRRTFRARIDDSKKLSAQQRYEAFHEIIASSPFGIGVVDPQTIDRVNILTASMIAMERAVSIIADKLSAPPFSSETPVPAAGVIPGGRVCAKGAGTSSRGIHVLVDGNMRPDIPYPCTSIVGGDGKSLSIAAASIVAKVVRDAVMVLYDRRFPQYGFARHKGYPTASHRAVLREHGMSPIHRRSFQHA